MQTRRQEAGAGSAHKVYCDTGREQATAGRGTGGQGRQGRQGWQGKRLGDQGDKADRASRVGDRGGLGRTGKLGRPGGLRKTEIIIFGPKSTLPTSQNFSLCIDGHSVTPSPLVRNLGIYMDPALSFKSHINHVTKTSFFHLRNIARLRPTLSFSAAETLIHAFITSRLDYCNSFLYGLPSTVLQKLQYVQNSVNFTGSP
ncbi:hypothetical protein N1851_017324 [Merluccius polli]|uniref:Uncharacterized protein n=1 Tax=Merluccius polli TaxID=89951 RepID=A0AA47MPN8_MERPO|nr:hypothetical protein N1851_017324 [Merluccius polli]